MVEKFPVEAFGTTAYWVRAADYDEREKEHDIELSDAAMREQALTAELAEEKEESQAQRNYLARDKRRLAHLEAENADMAEDIGEKSARIAQLEAALRELYDRSPYLAEGELTERIDKLLDSSAETPVEPSHEEIVAIREIDSR